jgi:hypothetical protein
MNLGLRSNPRASLSHAGLASTVRYTALAPDRFKELLEGLERGRPPHSTHSYGEAWPTCRSWGFRRATRLILRRSMDDLELRTGRHRSKSSSASGSLQAPGSEPEPVRRPS